MLDKRMLETFKKIKLEYDKVEQVFASKKRALVKITKGGVWGPSDCITIFKLFKKIRLERCGSFVDLGSGDGRVVLIASLFTKAIGFERDKELINIGERIRKKLKLKCEFRNEDYCKHDLSKYGVLFVYPDKMTNQKLKEKLLKELKGRLFVYRIFKPNYLKKIKDYPTESNRTITEYINQNGTARND